MTFYHSIQGLSLQKNRKVCDLNERWFYQDVFQFGSKNECRRINLLHENPNILGQYHLNINIQWRLYCNQYGPKQVTNEALRWIDAIGLDLGVIFTKLVKVVNTNCNLRIRQTVKKQLYLSSQLTTNVFTKLVAVLSFIYFPISQVSFICLKQAFKIEISFRSNDSSF